VTEHADGSTRDKPPKSQWRRSNSPAQVARVPARRCTESALRVTP
jgi:hypothetical protein